MNKKNKSSSELKLFIPYLKIQNYAELIPSNAIIYGRLGEDHQKNCLLFTEGRKNMMNNEDIQFLRKRGFFLCYAYDMFDLENREFSIEGFKSIIKDIEMVIELGFTHILLSNPFLIEIACNEYNKEINIIISSQLEINSSRGRLFFEVLNNISPITHLIVSQNHLNESRLREIVEAFPDMSIILEVDRFASDNQLVHEHYYNIVYSYHNIYALERLKRYVSDKAIKKYLKEPEHLWYDLPGLMYKIGEVNVIPDLFFYNLNSLLNYKIRNIKIIDFYLWNKTEENKDFLPINFYESFQIK